MAHDSSPTYAELARALTERDEARRDLEHLRHQLAWVQRIEMSAEAPPPERLREACAHDEQLFSLLVDAVTDYAITMLDPEGRVLTWNRGAQRLKGYQAAEILGENFARFYPLEDVRRGKPAQLLRMALAEGRAVDQGWEVRKDGTTFWADALISPIRDAHGALVGFAKVTRDLTERRKAEEQANLLALVVRSVKGYAIFRLDPQGNVMSWNTGARQIKGYADAEVIGQPFAIFFTPEDQADGKPQRLLQQARTRGQVEDEGWRVRKDGTRFWASAVLTAMYDEQHHLMGFAKVTRDLSERKQMEDALQQTIERLRAVTGNAPVVLFSADPQGVIRFAEGKGKAPIQAQGGELVGKSIHQVFGGGNNLATHLQRAMQGETVTDVVEVAGVTFEVWLSPLTHDEKVCGVTGVIGVALDVTDRKRLEDALKVQYEKLKELDKLKSDFVNAVSHDLRTPLTSIVGYAEFLEDEVGGSLAPDQREFVTQIQKGSKRLEHLVDNLLDFARIEAGSFQLRLEEADLRGRIEEVIESVRPLARSAGLNLVAELPPEPLIEQMDPARIERAMTNLVNNAIKFTPTGGTITIRACRLGDRVRCEVQDTGIGIAPEDLPQLFERFVQLEAGKKKLGGTGLGLSISKAIIETHGGQLGVESKPGEGSTFWFDLPLVAHPAAASPSRQRKP